MSMEQDKELIATFSKERKHSDGSIREYRSTLLKYASFCNSTLSKLLKEADDEEIQGIQWKRRKIRKRLMEYRTYLFDTYSHQTAKVRFGRILTFYRHFEVELQPLPSFSPRALKKKEITFKDLPTEKILKKTVELSNPLMKAIILFMSSSGTAKSEVLWLKIQDFIDATSRYHNSNNIYEVLDILKDRNDIIPLFYIFRKKTGKYYHTCCTPEAVIAIINYLITEERILHPEDPLFKISKQSFSENFQDLDSALYGEEGYYSNPEGNDEYGHEIKKKRKSKFTSHMIRRWHATTLSNEGMRDSDIDALQGRRKEGVIAAYAKINPEKLRETYIKYMKYVSIEMNIENLDLKSDEYIKLEAENNKNKETISNYESILETLDSRLKKIETKIQNEDKFNIDDFDFV